ncbi:MAG: TIGR01777 family oxidoreductase [Actinomycetota bacterium]
MDIAITGSSGLLGSALRPALQAAGHRVIPVVRPGSDPRGGEVLRWDPDADTIDTAGFEGLDAVIHLAGVSIGDTRWTGRGKAAIKDSRVQGTTLLARTLAALQRPPATLLSASASGYYGDRGDEVITERSPVGTGFRAEVCSAWEAAARPAADAGIRLVLLRSSIVLSPDGGLLPVQLLQFRLFGGGRFGSGRQWTSWISLPDELGAVVHLLHDAEIEGPVNLTAPAPVTNAEYVSTLGRVLHRPSFWRIPGPALQIAAGSERAREVLLSSERILPERLTASGYVFKHPQLEAALRDLLGR